MYLGYQLISSAIDDDHDLEGYCKLWAISCSLLCNQRVYPSHHKTSILKAMCNRYTGKTILFNHNSFYTKYAVF